MTINKSWRVFQRHTPRWISACLLISVHVASGIQLDSVYSHPLTPPDFTARAIEAPIPPRSALGLNLINWSYTAVIDTAAIAPPDSLLPDSVQVAEQPEDRPVELTLSIEEVRDILQRAQPFLKLNIPELGRWADTDPSGRYITFYQEHDGIALKLPSTISLDWYIPRNMAERFRDLSQKKFSASIQPQEAQARRRGRTVELLGADIAGQRVSLRVSGNVAIDGGLAFKDQSKSFTNFRANRQWDIEVNQKQRFDIEGSIGDRITVLVKQDSENDFEWENDMKINYKGKEDEILQRIEAGNISLALPGTKFATGGSGKSNGLFGLKAVSQLGPVDITTVASIERSRKSTKSSELAQEYSVSDQYYIQGRYFFLDTEFREQYYPLYDDGLHPFNSQRVVTRLEVYRSATQSSETYSGTAYVDPNDRTVDSSYTKELHFKRLIVNEDYTYKSELGWIRLRNPASDREIIAVAYALGDQAGTEFRKVGDIDTAAVGQDFRLKLIKGDGQTAGHPTWPLAFKNVYSLGGMNIVQAGFEVKVVHRRGATGDEDRFSDGSTYLEIFGLDRQNNKGETIPDDSVDVSNQNIVNLALGELHFPALLPFAYSDINGLATNHDAIKEIYGYTLEDPNQDFVWDKNTEDFNSNDREDTPAIYYRPRNTSDKNNESRFDIQVKQVGRGASEYNLGFNLVEGSETVYVNGNMLARGTDYSIDYFSGTLTILQMQDYGADPDVSIDYEENVLISFDKKVMLGTRAELDLGENSFLGATGLYYNQSIVDERVDVGSEPIRNILWDVNGRFARNVPLITRLVDRLPFLETDAVSKFKLEGEIAQVLPNPNPLGQAFVDDFEASKRTTSPSMIYRAWQPASPPVDKRPADRRKLAWWNPYTDVLVTDVWPNRQTSVRARNMTTTVLVLNALFEQGYEGEVREEHWGGLTYPLLASDYDQTQSKFFEIWIRGSQGKLHVDVGHVSEDRNGNRKLDSEDRPSGGFDDGNGLLESDEDVGLDGAPDEFEDGMGGSIEGDYNGDGEIDEDELYRADDDGDGQYDEDSEDIARMIYEGTYDGIYDGPRVTWADLEDPNGDNFRTDNPRLPTGRNDKINGTEGNSVIQEGSYPDTEDLDGSKRIDKRNDYFTYDFWLDSYHPEFDSTLKVGETYNKDGTPTHWRLFRIPLSEFTKMGDANVTWDNVKHLRLWVDGVDGSFSVDGLNARLQIAQIEFVGNEWQELGLAHIDEDTFTDSVISLAVTVANTEDNDDYMPPPGIEGEYDRLNDIRLREQSLALDFRKRGIPAEYKGAVKKSVVPNKEGTFLVYGSMEMFLYGEGTNDLIREDTSFAQFWLRLVDDKKYYEIRKTVYSGGPDPEHAGWDRRNHLNIDLGRLARLKLDETPDTTIYLGSDTTAIRGYHFDDGMDVYIKGDPSLESINNYIAGVTNTHPTDTLKGRIMMDEMRLSDVHREKGVAMRLSGSLNFADLMTTTFNYTRQDADFHTVQQRVLKNATTRENWRADVTINPHRFLPQSWGIATPISMNYSTGVTSPKYFPGRDIPVGDFRAAPAEIQTRSEQVALKTSFNKSTRSKNWVMRQTLDRLRGSISYTNKQESSVQVQRNEVTNIGGQVGYPIKFSEENYVEPFKKLENLPLIGGRIKDTRVYYTPSNVDFSANLTEALTSRITRAQPDTTQETYSFTMARNVKGRYRLTERLSADYAYNANSALDEFRFNKLDALTSLDMGLTRQMGEQFSFNYSPELVSWLKPKFRYQARYTWMKNAPLDDPERGGKIGTQGGFSGNTNLKLTDILEIFYTPEKKAPTTGRGRRGRAASQTPTTPTTAKKPLEIKNPQMKAVLKKVHAVVGKVSPLSVNYAHNRRGGEPYAVGVPDYAYRLAFVTESNLPIDSLRAGNQSQRTEAEDKDLSFRSGLSLSRSVNLTFSHARKRSASASKTSSTETTIEDFLILGDEDEVGIPFINWSLKWSNLENLPLLKKVPWKVSLNHTYTGKHIRSTQNQNVPSDKYSRQFQPLVGLTMNFTNGIASQVRYSHTLAIDQSDQGRNKTTGKQITASLSFQHRGGITLPLPFLEDLTLNNTINLSLDFNLSSDLKEQLRGEVVKYTTTYKASGWSIKPQITYTFTDKVTGGFHILYEENDHYITGKRINRDFRFDVNIAIRGS
ncbi:cell surface protein SprA [Candidatus Neomarinimicrobiota bacterium]